MFGKIITKVDHVCRFPPANRPSDYCRKRRTCQHQRDHRLSQVPCYGNRGPGLSRPVRGTADVRWFRSAGQLNAKVGAARRERQRIANEKCEIPRNQRQSAAPWLRRKPMQAPPQPPEQQHVHNDDRRRRKCQRGRHRRAMDARNHGEAG